MTKPPSNWPFPWFNSLDHDIKQDLKKFLDAAAGEGYVLDGVDAADLYNAIFKEE